MVDAYEYTSKMVEQSSMMRQKGVRVCVCVRLFAEIHHPFICVCVRVCSVDVECVCVCVEKHTADSYE